MKKIIILIGVLITILMLNSCEVDNNLIGPDETSLIKLNQNIPNPFSNETIMSFLLKDEGNVILEIYSLDGKNIITLLDEYKTPGRYEIIWNGRNENNEIVSSGTYLYRLKFKEDKLIKTLTIER